MWNSFLGLIRLKCSILTIAIAIAICERSSCRPSNFLQCNIALPTTFCGRYGDKMSTFRIYIALLHRCRTPFGAYAIQQNLLLTLNEPMHSARATTLYANSLSRIFIQSKWPNQLCQAVRNDSAFVQHTHNGQIVFRLLYRFIRKSSGFWIIYQLPKKGDCGVTLLKCACRMRFKTTNAHTL